MGDLARYRLFLTFLAVPVVVIVLIIILLVNAFGGDEQATTPASENQSEVLIRPTLAIAVVTVESGATLTGGTVTPTSTAVTLPVSASTPQPTPEPTATPAPTPTRTTQEYEIQPDDTLSEIADRFGLTTIELAAANEIENSDDIRVGDILIIPPPPAGGERAPLPTPTATPTPISATVDPAEGLNVREEPTIESEVLEIVPEGSEILLTGAGQTIDDIEWVEIVDSGWVQSQYLTIEGE